MMDDRRTQKQQLLARKQAMWQERSTWIARYQDITKYLLPYSGRYLEGEQSQGARSFNSIYDETATLALDILTAGMMAGMTSPARPWFRLGLSDKDLMEYAPVKLWLNSVTVLMRDIFAKSNTYNALHSLYEELGAFATGASILEDDFENVIHHHVLTAGEYAIATNDKGRVNTLARDCGMTVAQVVERFVYNGNPNGAPDWSTTSTTVKNLWDSMRYDQWVNIFHIIQPREHRDIRKRDAKNMAFSSAYVETGGSNDKILRESGYKRFNVIAPRWHVRGRDIYGNGPSFRALGSIKELQHGQLRKGQAIDYKVKPAVAVHAQQRGAEINMLPGGVSFIPHTGQQASVRNLFDVNIDLGHLLNDIQDVRHRINKSFYADLFLMISQDNRATPASATEIAERHEEKLLMLGPVLERLHNEMLSPKIDLTFARVVEAGILPPPPVELQGLDLSVEFISTLAQAQKMVGIGAMDGFLGRVAQVAQGSGDLSVWDKVDKDQSIDRYADMFGVDPSTVVADDKVVIIREERAQASAKQQMLEKAPEMAGAVRNMAAADTGDKNALTDMLRGYTTPQV